MDPVTVNISFTSLASAAGAGLTPKNGDLFGSLLLALQLNPLEATTGTAVQVPLTAGFTAGTTSLQLQDGTPATCNSPTAKSERDPSSEFRPTNLISREEPMARVPSLTAETATGAHGSAAPATQAGAPPASLLARAMPASRPILGGMIPPGHKPGRCPVANVAAAPSRVPIEPTPAEPSKLIQGVSTSAMSEETAATRAAESSIAAHSPAAEPVFSWTAIEEAAATQLANTRAATKPVAGTSLLPGADQFPAETISFSNGGLSGGKNPAGPAQVRLPNDTGHVLGSPVAVQRSFQSPQETIDKPRLYVDPQPPTPVSSAAAAGPGQFAPKRQVSSLPDTPSRAAEIAFTALGTLATEIEQKPVSGLQETKGRTVSQPADDPPLLPTPAISAAEPHAISSEQEVTFDADIAGNESPMAYRSVNDLRGAIHDPIPSVPIERASAAEDGRKNPPPSLGTSSEVTPNPTEGNNSAASGGSLYQNLETLAAAETDQTSPRASSSKHSTGAAKDPGDRTQPVAPAEDLLSAAARSPREAPVPDPELRAMTSGSETLHAPGSANSSAESELRTPETHSDRSQATASATGNRSQSGSESESEVTSNGGKPVASPVATTPDTQDVVQGGDTTSPSNPAVQPIEVILGGGIETSPATAVTAARPDDPKVAQKTPGKAPSQDQQKVSLPPSTQTEFSSDGDDDPQLTAVGSPEGLTPQANQSRTHDAAIPLQSQAQAPLATSAPASDALSAAVSQTQTQVSPNRPVPDGRLANTPGPAPGAAAAPELNPPVQAATVVQAAHVLERLGQTEMRIGVSAGDFGSVEVRASVIQDRLGASITATHQDLRAAMMAEMPALERAMEQHQLRLDQFDLGAQVGSRSGGSSPQQQPSLRSGPPGGFHASRSNGLSAERDHPLPTSGFEPNSSRLNVHA